MADARKRAISRAPTIWMNVTTSAGWTRPPVGIVRVEQELWRELATIFGDRFATCIFKDGRFIRYGNRVSHLNQGEPAWPDPSFDFPHVGVLGGRPPRHPAKIFADEDASSTEIFAFGDVVISVGLDWEWDKTGLTHCLRKLKTKNRISVISCCYDLIPILYPQYCVGDVAAHFKKYFTNLTWSSSMMLCISEQTRRDYKDLVNSIGLPEIPTSVIPLGANIPEGDELVSSEIKKISSEPFILFVSTIERRKNHEVLYRAYHRLAKAGHADRLPKLVFVGMPGWGVGDLLKDIELDPVTQGLIVQLSHVNDAELRHLYENCFFFAYPSLYEGWGLPIAEALAVGRPVIASACGSIPEVGGDLVQYVEPWAVNEWADAILHYVSHSSEVDAWADRIKREFRPNSWRSAAIAVCEAIEELSSLARRPYRFVAGYDLSTQVGVKYGSKIISTGEGGILCYGPYVSLPAASVRIGIEFEVPNGSDGRVTCRIQADGGRSILIERDITLIGGDGLVENFEMDIDIPRDLYDFECVIFVSEGFKVGVNSLSIEFCDLGE